MSLFSSFSKCRNIGKQHHSVRNRSTQEFRIKMKKVMMNRKCKMFTRKMTTYKQEKRTKEGMTILNEHMNMQFSSGRNIIALHTFFCQRRDISKIVFFSDVFRNYILKRKKMKTGGNQL